jgi:ADP-ribose pyrophosphatase
MKKRWKLLKSKPIFESKWLSLYSNTYKLPNGETTEGFYHVARSNYVLVLAIDNQKRIIVERQYRRAVDNFVYELPAGSLKDGESPAAAAIRELKEETGFEGTYMGYLNIYPEPEFMSMEAYAVVLRIDAKSTEKINYDKYESYQINEMKFIKVSKVKKMISEGKIKDMGFLAALQFAESKGFI